MSYETTKEKKAKTVLGLREIQTTDTNNLTLCFEQVYYMYNSKSVL